MATQRATYNGITVLVTRGYADKTVDLITDDGSQTFSRVNPKDVVLEPWQEEPEPVPAPVDEVKAPAARARAKAKKPAAPTTKKSPKKPITRKRSR